MTKIDKPFLRRPPKRRGKKNVSQVENGLVQRKDPPVCERIKLSYVRHPEIPLRIVNPLGKEGKQFDLFHVSGTNINAVLDESIYHKIAGWWREWTATILFDLSDEKLTSGFHDQKVGIVRLHNSTSKASAAVDVARILGKHVARANKYPIYLDFLHLCVLRVCVYWEPDPRKV
jgi:hypothetical protein